MTTKQAATLSSELERPAFSWLDTLAEPLQSAIHTAFRSGNGAGLRVKSWLNGTPLRHRMHPGFVLVPLGAWTTAAVLDVLDDRKPKRGYGTSADAAVAFGVVGALPAVAAGLADWVDLYDQQRRVGMAHWLMNSVALTCYGVSLALRLADGEQRGVAKAFSGVGFATVMLGGALGGELVYTLGVNVPWLLYPKPPERWMDVLASGELNEATPMVVEVERVPVLLVRREGHVLAVQEWCPHAGGPLSKGKFEGDVVECPWHQSRFCLTDGAPLQGPAATPLRTFETREENGRIKIRPSYEGQSWPPAPVPPRDKPERVEMHT